MTCQWSHPSNQEKTQKSLEHRLQIAMSSRGCRIQIPFCPWQNCDATWNLSGPPLTHSFLISYILPWASPFVSQAPKDSVYAFIPTFPILPSTLVFRKEIDIITFLGVNFPLTPQTYIIGGLSTLIPDIFAGFLGIHRTHRPPACCALGRGTSGTLTVTHHCQVCLKFRYHRGEKAQYRAV